MLPKYRLMIPDFYNNPIGNVKKIVLKIFNKKNRVSEFNQLQWLKLYIEFNSHKKRIEGGKAGKAKDKDGKVVKCCKGI